MKPKSRSALAASPDNFRRIVEHFQKRIFALALVKTGNADVAQDIAQETFIDAYRELDSLQDPDKLGAWLATIASRKCARHLASRKPAAMLSDDMRAVISPDMLELQEQRRDLLKQIQSLPEFYQQVIRMRYLEELSPQEIARHLDKSTNHIEVTLHRARLLLKERLQSRMQE